MSSQTHKSMTRWVIEAENNKIVPLKCPHLLLNKSHKEQLASQSVCLDLTRQF